VRVTISGWSGEKESIKSQIPSTKLQINSKIQNPMTKTGFEFRILVIVICLRFEIWNFWSFQRPVAAS
jgi:hypothetical protein